MKVFKSFLIAAVLMSSCKPLVSHTPEKGVSTFLSGLEISDLDQEYTFSSKALTMAYLKNKIERLIINDGVRLVKEIEYARYKGGGSIPFQDLITAEPSLLSDINNVPEVIAEKAINTPFAVFLGGVSNSGLAAYYPLDGNTLDYSGNNQHGTGSNLISTEDKSGTAAKAYSFNGSSGKVVLPNFINGTWTRLSFSVWVKGPFYTGNSYPAFIGSYTTSGESYNHFLGISPITKKLWLELDTTSGNFMLDGQLALPVDTWYHAVMVYDGATLTEYINGVAGASRAASGTLKAVNSIQIGNLSLTSGNYHFQGSLDNVRVYNRALSAAEVQALYNSGL